jgi:hypothetical protein
MPLGCIAGLRPSARVTESRSLGAARSLVAFQRADVDVDRGVSRLVQPRGDPADDHERDVMRGQDLADRDDVLVGELTRHRW